MPWLKSLFLVLVLTPLAFGAPPSKKLSQKEAAQKLVTIAAAIQNHELQLSAVEQELNQARTEESAILEELDHHNQRLMETIHYLRHATQYSPLLAMLSASKPEDIIHSSLLLRSITPEIHHRNQQLLEKVKSLSYIRSQLEAKQNELQVITFQYHQEREKLDNLLSGPSQPSLSQDENETSDPNELSLIKPVIGKLIATYASTNPEFASFNQGVLITTRSEAQVISPISGAIALPKNNAINQGKMVSVQTPNALIIMSGLASVNRNCVEGQNILAGEPIGLMPKNTSKKPNVSAQKMPKLYLEVWHQGQIIDPQTVLKESRNKP